MPLVENTQSEQFIDKTTEIRKILFTNQALEYGFISDSNFSVQKVLDGYDHFFGTSTMNGILEFKKAKHAYIYSQSDYSMEADTVLALDELQKLDFIDGQTIYVLPLLVDKEVEYDDILKQAGIDNVLSWFDEEDPFLFVFNKVHEVLGNNPEDFIYS